METVRDLAAQFAEPLGYEEEAALAGLLHDCGKYGELFQQRLQGKIAHVDHWSAGAYLAFKVQAVAASLAIYGHHVGLQQFSNSFFRSVTELIEGKARNANGLILSGNIGETLERFTQDGFQVAKPARCVFEGHPSSNSAIEYMLAVRFLYSCLVDADFLDTEAHFNQTQNAKKVFREPSPALDPGRAFSLVKAQVAHLAKTSKASPMVQALREAVWSAAIAASTNTGNMLWTLTAPTGSGKTLAMLGLALNHAKHSGKVRIIVALPYLNLIEQTASIYRQVLADMGENYIIEHHSLAERDADDSDGRGRLASDNWDAPIIVTTTVQLFESLFSNRPGRARKIHNMANSVILLDEIQTLPLPVVVPTIAALAALKTTFRATVVLGTATQPAFGCLKTSLDYITQAEYAPQEIAVCLPPRSPRVTWEFRESPQSWSSIADELRCHDSFLAIVNVKRHAIDLAEALGEQEDEAFFHLSTNMCPLHRSLVLAKIRERLEEGLKTHVVSTQCVEAGVDVDFPVVYRAWGPVDSLVQAAGRCNREGSMPRPGRVVVFQPEDDVYPPGPYQQGTQIAKVLWREGRLDLDDPDTMARYWEVVYGSTRPLETYSDLIEAIKSWDFVEVSKRYQLIPDNTIQVLVPYEEALDLYETLLAEARSGGIARRWIQRAQPLSVSLFRPPHTSPMWSYLEPVKTDRDQESGWWLFRERQYYSKIYGLCVPDTWGLLYT
ncbi:MAG: CRISPR-associated endonuclease Cas3'' [Firmicutes bacterium]|nr:CRISPR-associated endonuclease Cas3'' [Bacillota bacterium]